MTSICFGIFITFCQPTGPTIQTISEYCKVHFIMKASRKDSSRIKKQVLKSNKVYRRLCRKKK